MAYYYYYYCTETERLNVNEFCVCLILLKGIKLFAHLLFLFGLCHASLLLLLAVVLVSSMRERTKYIVLLGRMQHVIICDLFMVLVLGETIDFP